MDPLDADRTQLLLFLKKGPMIIIIIITSNGKIEQEASVCLARRVTSRFIGLKMTRHSAVFFPLYLNIHKLAVDLRKLYLTKDSRLMLDLVT